MHACIILLSVELHGGFGVVVFPGLVPYLYHSWAAEGFMGFFILVLKPEKFLWVQVPSKALGPKYSTP